MSNQKNRIHGLYFLISAVFIFNFIWLTCPVFALCYWPADYNDYSLANFERPSEDCMARINKASDQKPTAVIIAPNFILTAYHWGDMTNKRVSIGAENNDRYIAIDSEFAYWDFKVYKVKKLEWQDANDANDPNNPPSSKYSLLKDADFDKWVNLYTLKDPNIQTSNGYDELGREIVIGSYGPIRLAQSKVINVYSPMIVPAGTLHWGRNIVSSAPLK